MMRIPTDFELEQLMHAYDPVKAHEYYVKNRKLKGRKKGTADLGKGHLPSSVPIKGNQPPLAPSKSIRKPSVAKTKQKQALKIQIQNMEKKLHKLEALIKKRMHEEAAEDRKGKAKKERSAKEKDKPKSAAEKAEIARENEKYRDKHKQELKNKSKSSGSKSKSSDSKSSDSKHSVSDLKSLATKVKGQIAVAKQKLAAL